jgi:hypothetical protein
MAMLAEGMTNGAAAERRAGMTEASGHEQRNVHDHQRRGHRAAWMVTSFGILVSKQRDPNFA